MSLHQYCTPEWLEDSATAYNKTPRFKKEFAKLNLKLAFRITADPEWGIDKPIIFFSHVEGGDLKRLSFISEEEACRESDFILAATPQEWKKILRKENKFVTDFMLGKIILEQGSKVGVLGVAPHSKTFVEALTPFDLQFPDEMSPEELEQFHAYVQEFRSRLGV